MRVGLGRYEDPFQPHTAGWIIKIIVRDAERFGKKLHIVGNARHGGQEQPDGNAPGQALHMGMGPQACQSLEEPVSVHRVTCKTRHENLICPDRELGLREGAFWNIKASAKASQSRGRAIIQVGARDSPKARNESISAHRVRGEQSMPSAYMISASSWIYR